MSLDHLPGPGQIGHGAQEPGQLPAHRDIRNGRRDERRRCGARGGGPAPPGQLAGAESGRAEVRILGQGGGIADAARGGVLIFGGARISGGGALAGVLHRVPGHAVRLTGRGHALAGGDLPGLVLSHDQLFPRGLPASHT
jgi:hypothetical protein